MVKDPSMFAKIWSGAHPTHVVERALFEAQIGSSFSNIQIRAFWLSVIFVLLLIVTSVSRGGDQKTCGGIFFFASGFCSERTFQGGIEFPVITHEMEYHEL
jgi:hypothetical protein